jgi:hypothetical protein
MNTLYSIEEIRAVVLNHCLVPDHLLDAYDKDCPDKAYLFRLLVEILAKAQGVDDPKTDFVDFVSRQATFWRKWVILAKEFREWNKMLHSAKADFTPPCPF